MTPSTVYAAREGRKFNADTNLTRRGVCPNEKAHTPCPSGYLAWHEWAEKKSRTHEQERCPGCGRLSIWKRKEPSRAR